MNSAGDRSSNPRRRPVSDWYVFFLDLGFILLIFGCAVLSLAAFPAASLAVRAGMLALSALILWLVRRALLGQIEKTPARPLDISFRSRKTAPSGIDADGEDPVREFLRRIGERFSPAHIHLFLLQPDGKTYSAATTTVAFSADGDWVQNLSSGTETRVIGPEPPADFFGDHARLFTLGARAAVALRKSGRLAGFAVLGPRPRGVNYSDEDLSQLRLWANRAMTAATREKNPQSAARDLLLPLSRVIHSAADLDVLLELLQSQILRLIPARSFRIVLAGDAPATLTYALYSDDGVRRKAREGVSFSAADDLAGEVVRSGESLLAEDYSEACRIRKLPQRDPPGTWAGIPLPAGADIAGAFILQRDAPFGEGDRLLLESIAAHAGPAISRILLRRHSIRRTELLGLFQRWTRRIAGAPDLATLSAVILSGARELIPSPAAFLLLPDPCGAWIVARQSGLTEGADGFPALGPDHPFTRLAVEDRPNSIAFLPDEDPFLQAMRSSGADFQCALSFPLRQKEKLTGWIVLWNPVQGAALPGEEETLMQTFATVAVAGLSAAGHDGKADPSAAALADELASLQRLDQELNGALDSFQAMAITLDWAIRYSDSAAGLAAGRTGEQFEVAAVRGYPPESAPEIKSRFPSEFEGWTEAVQTGRAVLRTAEGSARPGLLPGGKSLLLVPVRRTLQTIGMLLLESEAEHAFSPAQMEFLERLASRAAIAIGSAQLYSEVRNADQAKSEFISFVAHELKTPMTSIRGYTDLLAQGAVGPVTQPQANFLATIRLNADRMSALVSDLNDISRIETGRLKLEFAAVALAPALEEVIDALRSQIESKEQKLSLDIPDDLPPVWVDRGRLIQILTNLVSNAQKYTLTGGSFRIAAEHSPNRWDPSGPPEVVHILLQDTGLGISPQEQKSIFQKFFRSEDRMVRDLPGTGLGLNITRNLVEMHGGKIWFESELHKGSTFHFTIPVSSV
jgi:signal transduction histidine kinase